MSLAENFCSPGDRDFQYVYESNGKKLGPLRFRCRQVSLYYHLLVGAFKINSISFISVHQRLLLHLCKVTTNVHR